MDSARAMVSDYARSGSGSSSSTSSTKYTQKRQRLEQITHSLEEPARTRNSVSSSRSSNQRSSNNKQSSSGSSRSNKRQPSSSSQSKAKDEKPNAVKTRSKNVEEEEQSNAKPDNQQHCIVCKRGVRNTRDLKHCQKCKKCSHATCNSGFVSLDTQNAYLCSDCAKKEKLASPTHSSNNNTTIASESNPIEEEEFVVSDEEANRPSCSQSVQTSEDELTSTTNQPSENSKNAPATGPQDNSIASNVQARKRNRRTRTRSSPQQQTTIVTVRSNSSASEEQSSPVGSKLLKTRISGSPSSSSIGISMTTAEPSNDAPSEVSLSPESVPEVAKISEESQAAKPTSQRSRKNEGNGKRSRVSGSQKKPTSTNRTGPTMRTRFAGQPTPNIAQVSTMYSMYERTGKTNRGRKSGKGKGGNRGGRRGKVLPTINKSRSRQVQSTSGFGQNSIDNSDAQDRLRSHDENDYVRTAVVTCSTNKFMDSVPLCIICGSVGQDTEAAMLTCASCAQSYHIFCINSRPNSTILERGWRCLDCSICEECGKDKDEPNIIICEECDISFHIYCLEPKLTQIPNGPWRCKWCATCSRCKNQVQSGLDLSTLEGFCETCYSLRKCPKCTTLYEAGDLLVKCQHCIRWFHARCEDLMTEEQVETASENAFRCTFCRPKMNTGYENSSLIIDNVMISRNTLDCVGTLRRPNMNITFSDGAFRPVPADTEDYDDDFDTPFSSRGGRGRGGPGRRVLKLGVGGFHVRMPRQRLPANTPDEKDKEIAFPSNQAEEEDPNSGVQNTPGKRMRRPRRPRRPKLEESYPAAIQEAFFGIQPVDSKSLVDVVVDEPVLGEHYNVKMEDKTRNLGCELSDQAADAIRIDDLGLFGDLLDDNMGIDFDLSLLMDEGENMNATATDGGFNSGSTGLPGAFGDGKHHFDGNFMHDEQNEENNAEEDSDMTNEQFHAQMEQSHEKQKQIQQQARLQMGSSSQPNGKNGTENGAKAIAANLSEKINQATRAWEIDEPLGAKATKAAVLFANIEHDYLKEKFPLWSDRVKRINNLWRRADSDTREKYVKKARENRADVPKRRTRRTDSKAQIGGSMEDLEEGSQDSNHSHLDNAGEPRNEAQKLQEPRASFNAEQTMYPNTNQQFKIATPRQSIDGHLNGMPIPPNAAQIPIGMRPMLDPKIHQSRPDNLKEIRSASLSQERVPIQTPAISAAEWEHYRILREKNNVLNDRRAKIDEELIKFRKVKKNSKAKLRSLCRNQEATQMNSMRAGYTNTDIIEAERRVETVTQNITDQQALMDQCKQEQKEVTAQIQSFETRYHLNSATTPMPITPLPDGHSQMPFPPQHPQQIMYPQQPTPNLSSPPYSFAPPGNLTPATFAPPFKQTNFYGMDPTDNFGLNSFYPSPSGIRLANFNNFQAASPIVSNPESPLRPTSSASTEVPKSSRGRKRRRPAEEIRTPKMGNVVYSSLTDPLEREIYSVVDLLVGWVEAAVDSGNETLFSKLPTMRTSNLQSDPETMSDAKAKRRRNIVRKPPNQDANEYEAFVEKLQNQLKLCPMPALTYEQSSFIDTSLPHFTDMTYLQQEIGHEFVAGSEIEDYHLTFMPDYYANVEKQMTFDQNSLYPPPMSKIYEDTTIEELESAEELAQSQIEGPTNESGQIEIKREVLNEEEAIVKSSESTNPPLLESTANESQQKSPINEVQKVEASEEKPNRDELINPADLDHYDLFWRDITSDEVGHVCCIPQMYKPNNDTYEFPIPPHWSVFKAQKTRHLDHRYAVTLTIENVNFDEKVLNELKAIIENPNDLEIIERTPPPESPQQIKEEPIEEIAESVVDQMCRHCDGLIKNSRVAEFLSKLGAGTQEDDELNTFCSLACYLTFMAETNTPIAPELYKHAGRFVDESIFEQLTQSESAVKRSELMPAEHELKLNLTGGTSNASLTRNSTTNLLSPIDVYFDPNYYSFGYEPASFSNELPLRVCDLPPLGQNNKSVLTDGEYKWKGFGWQIYDDQLILSFKKVQEDIHQKLIAVKDQCADRNRIYRHEDTRVCAFCNKVGDGDQDVVGRLLNIDANKWVHVNCALWSAEVYENENGVLKNVDVALKSAQTVHCKVCQRVGASLKCYKHACENNKSFYHLSCAKEANAKFGKDKLFFCPNHEIRPEVCMKKLGALRRICIEREETQLLAKVFNHSYPTEMSLRVGSMIFRNIGQLSPEQLKNFHSEEHIYPVGYHITRIFWSPTNSRELSRYECTISDDDGQPMFHVQLIENHSKLYSDRTMAGAWSEIFQSVKRIRNKEMLQFYPELMNASTLFGLQEPTITKIAESLPGVDQMFKYSLSHENSPLLDLPLAVNPTGCARCEPRSRALIKHRNSRPLITQSPRKKMQIPTNNEFTPEIISREARRTRSQRCIFTTAFGDESYAQLMRRSGITESMLTASHVRYDTASLHNAHSQYRKMKQEWRKYVYLGRSGIQGLGLFAKMDLDMNTMIIEYLGEVIRSELGEVREKKYLSQNRGIYMFRIDEEYIVDATMTGGLARYVNHSCDPNCTTKILQYNEEKKIVIIANRPIKAGEELTYEYNFELEDNEDKIACLCGAPNCVKWMN